MQNIRDMPGTMKMWAAAPKTVAGKRKLDHSSTLKVAPGKPPKPSWRRSRWLRIVKWLTVGMLAMLALGAATIAFVFWLYGRDPNLPSVDAIRDYTPKQTTQILDTNGHRIGQLGKSHRTIVPYEKIPKVVLDAFVAAEDNSFWTHGGIDYFGMVRAAIKNVVAGHTTQGGSTITMQVVKNILLDKNKKDRSFKYKIQQIILARRLEQALTKERIIWLYLNEIDFGHNTNGIQEAARLYFGKNIEQVDAGEAALLASLPKEPELFYQALHGRRDDTHIRARRRYVLDQMEELGYLDAAAADKFRKASINIVEEPKYEEQDAEWVEIARQQLLDLKVLPDANEDTIESFGGKVRTTLDPDLQQRAHRALQAGLRAADVRQGIGRAKRHLKGDKIELEVAKLAKALPAGGPAANERYDAVVTAVHDDTKTLDLDLGKWKTTLALGGDDDARFNPDGKAPAERFKQGDLVEVVITSPDKSGKRHARFAPGPEGAVVILEVKTRKVRALVGGYASKIAGYDRALQARRQPGSSFKPFVYTTAIDSGKYTAASRVDDAPEVFEEHPNWKPKNYETGKFEGPVLLRHALAKSINTVSLRVTYDVKPESVVAMAHKLGIQSKLDPEMSIALGSFEVRPIEMTNALATLAAGGIYAPPQFVEAVDDKAIEAVKGEQVLRPEVAYVVTNMMQSVVQEGTGIKAAALKIPIAGKTGTSNEAKDTWFVGLTPDYAIGVWIGYDDAHPMGSKETGGTTAVPVYVDVMKELKPPAKQFQKPPHVVEVTIDRETGLVAADGAPKSTVRAEVFVEGTQPKEIAPKPGEVTEGSSVTGEYGD